MDWMHQKKRELSSIREIEKALMNKQSMREVLNRYVTSLDLQGQINRSIITDQQAAQLFRKAIQDFSYQLNQAINNTINQAIQNKQLDQDDLSNPLNMQQALNNPSSITSQLMDDTAAAVIAAYDEESMANEQMITQQINEQQQITEQQSQQEASDNQAAFTPKPTPTSQDKTEKEALLTEAALGVTAGKKILDDTVEKFIGKKLEHKLGGLSGEEESLEGKEKSLEKKESPFKIPTLTLKPESPKIKDGK